MSETEISTLLLSFLFVALLKGGDRMTENKNLLLKSDC